MQKTGNAVPVRRDTPDSIALPAPLCFSLQSAQADDFGELQAEAKVYDDGAVTIVVRGRTKLRFESLTRVCKGDVVHSMGRDFDLKGWAEELFQAVRQFVAPAIIDPIRVDRCEREAYTAFCLLECPEGPEAFIKSHKATAAKLLVGDDGDLDLHDLQIEAALRGPFSYLKSDYAIFDMERCLLIDPRADYEDILLIIEHANYRLLELRVLDKLLDSRLDEAEKDLVDYGSPEPKKRRRLLGDAPQAKFARIQELRFEALFVLENLENSAKIIGDFYLGQIYERLCAIFNTDGWSRSVEHRLDVLSSVYDMAKTDSAERKMLLLEIIFIVVCVVFPVIQIVQVLLLG
ncbi:hypothetical protein MASR2M78_08520 [Treponema sp.]